MRIEKIRKEYEVAVRWRAFPLHPDIPEEGISIEELFADRPVDIQETRRRLVKAAENFGVAFKGSGRIYNSRLAQELGLWAESKDKGDEIHTAIFKAYFVDGKNIAQIPLLVELAVSVGLPEREAEEILARRAIRPAVDLDWALSREESITAVPTLVLNRNRLVGAQPYEAIQMLMEANGIQRKPRGECS